jgi:ABC-type phosphate/phosphonate transport system permease subunit
MQHDAFLNKNEGVREHGMLAVQSTGYKIRLLRCRKIHFPLNMTTFAIALTATLLGAFIGVFLIALAAFASRPNRGRRTR